MAWRRHRATDLPLLGSCVSAVEAHRLIRLILKERYTRKQLAEHLGVHHGLARLRQQGRITWKTLLKVRRFYRLYVADVPPDSGLNNNQSA